jgi:hypothetical protein
MERELMKLTAILACCLALASLSNGRVLAEENQPAATIRKNYDDCFYNSVANQLKASRTTDFNFVSETAFQACSTEEQAIGLFLVANNVRRDTVAAMIIKIKLDLKKSIRDIAANPKKYLP